MLIATPAIAQMLPDALLSGVTSAHFAFSRVARGWPFLVAAVGIFWLAWLGREVPGKRQQAILATSLAALSAIAYFKIALLPVLDQRYSVRAFFRENAVHMNDACVKDVRRDWAYGLNYYAGHPLPECAGNERQVTVRGNQLTIR
jgi:hypothetical protein